jgi:hypothetical protein
MLLVQIVFCFAGIADTWKCLLKHLFLEHIYTHIIVYECTHIWHNKFSPLKKFEAQGVVYTWITKLSQGPIKYVIGY